MKVLELDAGNTRLKWRLINDCKVLARGALDNDADWFVDLSTLIAQWGHVDVARMSAVSGSEKHNLLTDIIHGGFGVPVQVACTKESCSGLTVAYQEASKLGVDRWLAMLAAFHQPEKGTKVVVDSGTALTVDIINPEGNHIGGYIVPGIQLMKKALHLNTAQLTVEDGLANSLVPGVNTLQCIDHGVLLMAVSMINSVIARYEDAVVYLTGGSVGFLQPHIKEESRYIPELVMDGLAFVFKES